MYLLIVRVESASLSALSSLATGFRLLNPTFQMSPQGGDALVESMREFREDNGATLFPIANFEDYYNVPHTGDREAPVSAREYRMRKSFKSAIHTSDQNRYHSTTPYQNPPVPDFHSFTSTFSFDETHSGKSRSIAGFAI